MYYSVYTEYTIWYVHVSIVVCINNGIVSQQQYTIRIVLNKKREGEYETSIYNSDTLYNA